MSEDDLIEDETPIVEEIKSSDGMHLVEQDTPINKATLAELPGDQQLKFIEVLQARRIKIREFTTKARASRDKASNAGAHAKVMKFDKLLEKLSKLCDKADKHLMDAEKLVDELQVHRLTMGEHD
jgi:hypothetical protein